MYKNNKFLDYLLIRKEDSNKGTYGKTIIIGGSINYPGSIVIASSAALKCGVGYVCLGVTKSVYNRVACVNPEVIYEVFEDDNFYDEKVFEMASWPCGCRYWDRSDHCLFLQRQ